MSKKGGMVVQGADGGESGRGDAVLENETYDAMDGRPVVSVKLAAATPAPAPAEVSNEMELFQGMWRSLVSASVDGASDGLAGASDVAAVLATCQLPRSDLRKIWSKGKQAEGGCPANDKMNRAEFMKACAFAVRTLNNNNQLIHVHFARMVEHFSHA